MYAMRKNRRCLNLHHAIATESLSQSCQFTDSIGAILSQIRHNFVSFPKLAIKQ
jgi:hypothetical protein